MLNFLSPEEGRTNGELAAVYGPELYERLLVVKQKYDPDNLFRFSLNLTAGPALRP